MSSHLRHSPVYVLAYGPFLFGGTALIKLLTPVIHPEFLSQTNSPSKAHAFICDSQFTHLAFVLHLYPQHPNPCNCDPCVKYYDAFLINLHPTCYQSDISKL